MARFDEDRARRRTHRLCRRDAPGIGQRRERLHRRLSLDDGEGDLLLWQRATCRIGLGAPSRVSAARARRESRRQRTCGRLGERDAAQAFYLECTRAWTSDLARIAVAGFGQLGPASATEAFPFLAEALRSHHSSERYVVVDALSRLGPTAAPLLRIAAADADPAVWGRVSSALAALQH